MKTFLLELRLGEVIRYLLMGEFHSISMNKVLWEKSAEANNEKKLMINDCMLEGASLALVYPVVVLFYFLTSNMHATYL